MDRLLDYDERLRTSVEAGRASALRGELLEHDEVVARIEKILEG